MVSIPSPGTHRHNVFPQIVQLYLQYRKMNQINIKLTSYLKSVFQNLLQHKSRGQKFIKYTNNYMLKSIISLHYITWFLQHKQL